jgi:hypothetical protein
MSAVSIRGHFFKESLFFVVIHGVQIVMNSFDAPPCSTGKVFGSHSFGDYVR